jgi:hypothetical protein
MAKAAGILSTLLDRLRALGLPPETLEALNSHFSRLPAAAAGLSKVPNEDDLARLLASVDPVSIDPTKIAPVAELLAKHNPLEIVARIEAGDYSPASTSDTAKLSSALERAVKKRLGMGEDPGKTVPWNRFCDNIRDECGAKAWIGDRKKRKPARGYGDRTIRRIVERLKGQN